jgi:hypothetical protein
MLPVDLPAPDGPFHANYPTTEQVVVFGVAYMRAKRFSPHPQS